MSTFRSNSIFSTHVNCTVTLAPLAPKGLVEALQLQVLPPLLPDQLYVAEVLVRVTPFMIILIKPALEFVPSTVRVKELLAQLRSLYSFPESQLAVPSLILPYIHMYPSYP